MQIGVALCAENRARQLLLPIAAIAAFLVFQWTMGIKAVTARIVVFGTELVLKLRLLVLALTAVQF